MKISILTSLYKCEQYLENYFSHVQQIVNLDEIEFIFIHNSPSEIESEIILNFCNKLNLKYNIISIERESLYKSWNRGIAIAKGKYIAIWNVDDIRKPNSLLKQSIELDKNDGVALVCGKKLVMNGKNIIELDINNKPSSNSIKMKKFIDGTFIMWRKKIHKEIGYFDEQFLVSGDQDFWYRVSSLYRIKFISCILGTYREIEGEGISKKNKNANFEKALIIKRYGFWSAVNIFSFFKLKNKYHQSKIVNYDKEYQLVLGKKSYFELIKIRYFVLSILFSISRKIAPRMFKNSVSRRYI